MTTPDTDAVPASIDHDFWTLFSRGDRGWTGGDSTYSVPLPDGRTVWLFSDTFLGPVNPDRSRPSTAPLIHNSFVVQDRQTLTTLHGGTPAAPRALFSPTDGSSWYWVFGGLVENDRLFVFLLKFLRQGSQVWEWDWTATDLVSLKLPNLEIERITPVPVRNGIRYGAAILQQPDYTYIYGVEDLHQEKYGHVARARPGQIRGPWEFFDGNGWSTSPEKTARMSSEQVGTEYSVIPVRGGFALITIDTAPPVWWWREVVAYFSPRPEGPWGHRTVLYQAPEPDQENIWVYNAHAHPQFSKPDVNDLLISYDVNSYRLADLYADADLFRARFIRVTLPDPISRQSAVGSRQDEESRSRGVAK